MSAEQKLEIIRRIESSGLPLKAALARAEVPPATYYRWRRTFRLLGRDALHDRTPYKGRVWNQLLQEEHDKILQIAMLYPEWSPREVACHLTDHGGFSAAGGPDCDPAGAGGDSGVVVDQPARTAAPCGDDGTRVVQVVLCDAGILFGSRRFRERAPRGDQLKGTK